MSYTFRRWEKITHTLGDFVAGAIYHCLLITPITNVQIFASAETFVLRSFPLIRCKSPSGVLERLNRLTQSHWSALACPLSAGQTGCRSIRQPCARYGPARRGMG